MLKPLLASGFFHISNLRVSKGNITDLKIYVKQNGNFVGAGLSSGYYDSVNYVRVVLKYYGNDFDFEADTNKHYKEAGINLDFTRKRTIEEKLETVLEALVQELKYAGTLESVGYKESTKIPAIFSGLSVNDKKDFTLWCGEFYDMLTFEFSDGGYFEVVGNKLSAYFPNGNKGNKREDYNFANDNELFHLISSDTAPRM